MVALVPGTRFYKVKESWDPVWLLGEDWIPYVDGATGREAVGGVGRAWRPVQRWWRRRSRCGLPHGAACTGWQILRCEATILNCSDRLPAGWCIGG